MFNSFSFSELLTVLVVIVIVFGPHRLPEMARKLGEWTVRARRSLDSLKAEIGADYKDVIDPIRGARDDMRGLRQELRDTAKSVVTDLDEAAKDVRDMAVKKDRDGGSDASTDITKGAPELAASGAADTPAEAGGAGDPDVGSAAGPDGDGDRDRES